MVHRHLVLGAILLTAGACVSRRVIVVEAPPERRDGPTTVHTLGIPPGHLPPVGQCRVWIRGVPPGRQARPRACAGILANAPAGAWIVYRPARDRRVVHVRLVHDRRPGIITIVRIFDVEGRFVREVRPDEEPLDDEPPADRRRPDDRRIDDRNLVIAPMPPPAPPPPAAPQPPAPPPPGPPDVRPRDDRPTPRDTMPGARGRGEPDRGQGREQGRGQQPPAPPPPPPPPAAEQRPGDRGPPLRPGAEPTAPGFLDIPPAQLPAPGECRIWIPGTPPGRQPRPASRPCDGIAAVAPAGSWIVQRPADQRQVHVRVVDTRRAGVVVRVRVFDLETNRLIREENP